MDSLRAVAVVLGSLCIVALPVVLVREMRTFVSRPRELVEVLVVYGAASSATGLGILALQRSFARISRVRLFTAGAMAAVAVMATLEGLMLLGTAGIIAGGAYDVAILGAPGLAGAGAALLSLHGFAKRTVSPPL